MLLITGFGPFPTMPDNPSGRVVERLEAQAWSPPISTLKVWRPPVLARPAAAAAASKPGKAVKAVKKQEDEKEETGGD